MLNIKSIHYPYLLYKTRPKPIRPDKNIKIQKHKMDFQRNHKPWTSGLWESLVKSVKKTLKPIAKDRIFTEDCLYTFLCEVEALLNSRPLTVVMTLMT